MPKGGEHLHMMQAYVELVIIMLMPENSELAQG